MRRAGVLLHPTSLPGPGPCGTLGAEARAWLDWLVSAKCSIWQILPLHPPGRDGSPYDSPSVFALDTRLIDIPDLVRDGVLPRSALVGQPRSTARIDAAGLADWHQPQVAQAALVLLRDDSAAVDAFEQAHPWARDWARFRALVDHHKGQGWWDLPAPYQTRHEGALRAADRAHERAIQREIAAQLIVHRQWQALRHAAHTRGIQVLGDLPIFVARDGADTWVHRSLFELDGSGHPDPVTGAPPDDFSALGQVWNNPHYRWEAHRADGFSWWVERFRVAMARHSIIRVDHFRGFIAAWAVPKSGDARDGTWAPAPGAELLQAAVDAVPGLSAVAEDLGHITDEVHHLRRSLGWPGMKVLQFAFDGKEDNEYLPPWRTTDWLAAPATHDNDTTVGWYETASDEVRLQVSAWAGQTHPCPDPSGSLIRAAWSSAAQWAVTPLQDLMRLGSWARMNTPGQRTGCWDWRAQALSATGAAELADLAVQTGRDPATTGAATRGEGL